MFDIKIKQEDFYSALKKVGNTVKKEKDTKYPFTRTLYMTVVKTDKSTNLKLITSNVSDISEIIIKPKEVTGADECDVLVDYERLYKVISTIDKETELNLVNSEQGVLQIKYLQEEPIVLNGLAADKFIQPPKDEVISKFRILHSSLKEAVDRAAAIVHENSSKPSFNNLNLKITKEGIDILGFNLNYQVPVISKIVSGIDTTKCTFVDSNIFIESKKFKKLISEFIPGTPVEISVCKNSLKLRQSNYRITTRLSADTFADLSKYFPKKYTAELEVEKSKIINALERLEAICEDEKTSRKCKIVFDENIYMHLESKAGAGSANVPCTKSKEYGEFPVEVTLNINILKEVIETMSTTKCLLSFASNKGGQKYCYVHPSGATSDLFKCSMSQVG